MSFHEEVNAFLMRPVGRALYAVGDRVVVTPYRLPALAGGDMSAEWSLKQKRETDEAAIDAVLSWKVWCVRDVDTLRCTVTLANNDMYGSERRLIRGRKTAHIKPSRIHPADAAYDAIVERARALQAEIAEAKRRDEEGRVIAEEIRNRAAAPGSGPLLAAVRALLEEVKP